MDFARLYEVLPKEPVKWDVRDVGVWLQFIGLSQYEEVFKNNSIDGSVFGNLSEQELADEIGITQKIIRKKLLNWLTVGFQQYSRFLQEKQVVQVSRDNSSNSQGSGFQNHKAPSHIGINQNQAANRIAATTNNFSTVQKRQQNCMEELQKPEHATQQLPQKIRHTVIQAHSRHSSQTKQSPARYTAQDEQDSFEESQADEVILAGGLIQLQTHSREQGEEEKYENCSALTMGQQNLDSIDYLNMPRNIFRQQEESWKLQSDAHLNAVEYQQSNQNLLAQAVARSTAQQTHQSALPPPSASSNSATAQRELILSPYEGNSQNFYCIGERGGKIGRHSSNTILILEESISRFHAEIEYVGGQFYLRDIGSTTGTFLKVTQRLELKEGLILELGSNQFQFATLNAEEQKLELIIIEGPQQNQVYELDFAESTYPLSIGRKSSNYIGLPDDHHLSSLHCNLYMIEDRFYLEDMTSTNGTWLRLSCEGEKSEPFVLQEQCVFKIGTQSSFSCKISQAPGTQHTSAAKDDNRGDNGDSEEKIASEKQNTGLEGPDAGLSDKNNDGLCYICCDTDRDALFMPCRHNFSCVKCSKNLQKCPLCKIKIQNIIKIYKV